MAAKKPAKKAARPAAKRAASSTWKVGGEGSPRGASQEIIGDVARNEAAKGRNTKVTTPEGQEISAAVVSRALGRGMTADQIRSDASVRGQRRSAKAAAEKEAQKAALPKPKPPAPRAKPAPVDPGRKSPEPLDVGLRGPGSRTKATRKKFKNSPAGRAKADAEARAKTAQQEHESAVREYKTAKEAKDQAATAAAIEKIGKTAVVATGAKRSAEVTPGGPTDVTGPRKRGRALAAKKAPGPVISSTSGDTTGPKPVKPAGALPRKRKTGDKMWMAGKEPNTKAENDLDKQTREDVESGVHKAQANPPSTRLLPGYDTRYGEVTTTGSRRRDIGQPTTKNFFQKRLEARTTPGMADLDPRPSDNNNTLARLGKMFIENGGKGPRAEAARTAFHATYQGMKEAGEKVSHGIDFPCSSANCAHSRTFSRGMTTEQAADCTAEGADGLQSSSHMTNPGENFRRTSTKPWLS